MSGEGRWPDRRGGGGEGIEGVGGTGAVGVVGGGGMGDIGGTGGMGAVLRQMRAVAWADLLERLRRYSFLVTLAGTLYFGYLVNAGYVRLTIHGVRGLYNSAWVGSLIAVSVGSLLSLVGFYLVKNTLDHDRRSGVGEILAATSMSRVAYILGKAISNFLLLDAIVALLALAAVVSQLVAREDTHVDAVALLAPIVLLTLPILALAAAAAVLFEAVRWLRGSFGNVLYFALWVTLLSLTAGHAAGGGAGLDPIGLRLVEQSFTQVLPAATAAQGDMALNIGPAERGEAAPPGKAAPGGFPPAPRRSGVRWGGIRWTAALVAQRLAWIGAALAVVLLAALLFSRFDPARDAARRGRGRRKALTPAPGAAVSEDPGAPSDDTVAGHAEGRAPAASAASPAWAARPRAWLDWAPRSRAFNLVLAELRLMLRGRNFWWFAAAIGLWIAGLFVPAGTARAMLLAVAWIWPLPLWSEMGARETLYGMRPLLLAAPLPPMLRSAAIWAAGAGIAALAGSSVALRLAMAGDAPGLLAWTAGCLFIPALALGLGTISGSPRLFEVVYLLLWYIGPMNHVPTLDFTGMTAAGQAAGYPWIYLALSALLFTAAAAARSRQTNR
jgi:hypothetical protein